jgi:hypothetical protein
MDESWGRCTVTTIPDSIVENLKTLSVQIVGEERPLAISGIQYGDRPWEVLKEWATRSSFEHSVALLHHPMTNEFSVTNVLGNGRPYPILPQYIEELRSLCKECSEESKNKFKSERNEGHQRSFLGGPGEYFYHAKYSWDTLAAHLQSPGTQYPLLSRLPPNAYICDMMFKYADCLITVSVYKESE